MLKLQLLLIVRFYSEAGTKQFIDIADAARNGGGEDGMEGKGRGGAVGVAGRRRLSHVVRYCYPSGVCTAADAVDATTSSTVPDRGWSMATIIQRDLWPPDGWI